MKNDIKDLTKTNETIIQENNSIQEEYNRIYELNKKQEKELTAENELDKQRKTNSYLHNDYKKFYLKRIRN